jgi:pimeloyl-ACP methyl ester carboxylesterase
MLTPPDNSSLYKSAQGRQEVMAHYDATLQGMGLPYESRYVETSFGLTHVIVSGNEAGKPIALWHGMGANAASWASWMPALAANYRLYAVDTIGDMGKSAPTRPSRKGPGYGQWAAQVLGGLGLQQANVVGVSNGAWLVARLGGVAPEMIGSAVLMSAAGLAPLSKTQVLRMLPRIMFKPPSEMARQMMIATSPPGMPPDPLFTKLAEFMLLHFRTGPNPTVLEDEVYQRLTAPTYLLMGQHEVLVNPYKALQRGLRLLPNLVRAEIVPGVGHSMIHKQPDWVTARLISFLDEHAL